MGCREFEDLILDYSEGAASPADRALLESHIAACGECRSELARQQELDLRLAKTLIAPALSPVFDARLAARLTAHSSGQSARYRWLPRTLDTVGYASLAAVAVYFLQQAPGAGIAVAVAASAAFTLWQTGKAVRSSFVHRP